MPLAPVSVLFSYVAGGNVSSAGFTRASDATRRKHDGTVQLTTQAVPKLDWIDPNSTFVLDVPSLLLEDTQTNDFTRSEELDNAVWVKTNLTVTANDQTAPDGSTTADRMVESTANGAHSIERASTIPGSDIKQAWSIFARAAERSTIYLEARTQGNNRVRVFFNVSTGSVGTADAGISTAFIERMGNSHFRCAAVINTSSGATTPLFVAGLATSDGNFSYEGSSTSGVYMWGAQLEATSS